MNKIKRSGKLLKAAFAVLFREKKLLLFPAIATVLAFVMALFFIIPIVLYPTGHSYFSVEHWSALGERVSHWFNFDAARHQRGEPMAARTATMLAGHPWTALCLALAYFFSMFLATFSNVAFYHEIMQALNGSAVSIRRGFRFAAARWRPILMWSLFAGLVGYLIQAIQERVGFLGRIITGFIGMAWSAACIFVIPALARDAETANPLKLLRNSAGTLKRTWGELIIGFAGLELAFGAVIMILLLVGVITFGVVSFYVCWHFNLSVWWAAGVLICMAVALAVPLGLISSVVNPVYRCALYIYATEGVVPGSFDQELLDSAWKVK